MLDVLAPAAPVEVSPALASELAALRDRIPPLWDLANYVAVNPFLGFDSEPIAEALRTVGDGLSAQPLPAIEDYRVRWREKTFGAGDLESAARRSGIDPFLLLDILEGRASAPSRESEAVLTYAERIDQRDGTEWKDQIVRSVSRWCAVYALGGGAYWSRPEDGRGLYASWLEAARVDRSLEIAGLSGWRRWVADLPNEAETAIATMLDRLALPDEARTPYLYRLLGSLYGWASSFRRSSWQAGDDASGDFEGLLAILICSDLAVSELAPAGKTRASRPASTVSIEEESVRLALQEAVEDGFAKGLIGKLAPGAHETSARRPTAQAVFCIDVRSEPLRRHLEARSQGIETVGFAGFFGVSLDWQADGMGSARCPVLLKPGLSLCPSTKEGSKAISSAVKYLQGAPGASFSFVESVGLTYGIGLAADALAWRRSGDDREREVPFRLNPEERGQGIDLDRRVDLAAGILKNTGLGDRLARLVLLCGHEGRSANNPHKAGLDCGACGGHGGGINARVAAAVLNDPAVHRGLRGRGVSIPADTRFVAGVHDTSTDEVTLLDLELVPASHLEDLTELDARLKEAGAEVRRERSARLGLAEQVPTGLLSILRRRARDWSEVRPEWALARNAAFIAAPRGRTRGVDLDGRAFLHDYDWTKDADLSVLNLILSAPMVVASWINLQYFASTVDNRVFGCGDKTIHNRVGSLGVVLGNGGDLRTGLPIQSVHSPNGRWFHDPLRLQVMVEAPRDRIDAVLDRQPGVRNLVENGWVRLFALDTQGGSARLRLGDGSWEDFG